MAEANVRCHAGLRGTARKWNVALLADGKMKTKALAREQKPLAALTEWLEKQGAPLRAVHVCVDMADEHTRAFSMALHDNGATVSRVEHEAVVAWAAPDGKAASSPAADAAALARYCAANNPEAWIPPPLEERLLKVSLESLTAYRKLQESEARYLEEFRRDGMDDAAESIERHRGVIEGAIAQIEREVERLLEEHPHLREKVAEGGLAAAGPVISTEV
jgi:transposase